MVAAELRRQADVFLDIVELQPKIGRDPAERAAREAPEPRERHMPQFLQRPTAPHPAGAGAPLDEHDDFEDLALRAPTGPGARLKPWSRLGMFLFANCGPCPYAPER